MPTIPTPTLNKRLLPTKPKNKPQKKNPIANEARRNIKSIALCVLIPNFHFHFHFHFQLLSKAGNPMNTPSRIALSAALLIGMAAAPALAENKPVHITKGLPQVTVEHDGKAVDIRRNPNNQNTINPDFAKTSRPCPPFCIQPGSLAPGVETIAELEVLDYAKRMSAGDDSIVLIDSRTPAWVKRGTIPSAINIPWTRLNLARGASPFEIADILQTVFGVQESEGLFDFSAAKTVVMFCNGMWCGQSPNNIRTLLKFGYPAHKIKWYRGGMQDWEALGLTTVKGD